VSAEIVFAEIVFAEIVSADIVSAEIVSAEIVSAEIVSAEIVSAEIVSAEIEVLFRKIHGVLRVVRLLDFYERPDSFLLILSCPSACKVPILELN
jgi:hypothetical protein